jgi:hypothetical protein
MHDDPITDGHDARYGYRCDVKAATRDSENALPLRLLQQRGRGGRFAGFGVVPSAGPAQLPVGEFRRAVPAAGAGLAYAAVAWFAFATKLSAVPDLATNESPAGYSTAPPLPPAGVFA